MAHGGVENRAADSDLQEVSQRLVSSPRTNKNGIYMYFIAGLWYNKPAIKLFLKEICHGGRGEKTYTAADINSAYPTTSARTFSHSATSISHTLFRSAAIVARGALTAPLAGGSGFISTKYNLSGLLINILFGPFAEFVMFFGKEMQDLLLAPFGNFVCCGTRKYTWCPEGGVSISYQPFAS